MGAALECTASLFGIVYAHTVDGRVGSIDGPAQNVYVILKNLSLAVSFGLVLGFSYFLALALLAQPHLDAGRRSLFAVHVFWGSALAVLACVSPLLCAAADSHAWDGIFLFCLAASISVAVFFVVWLGRSLVSESTTRRDRNDGARTSGDSSLSAVNETSATCSDTSEIVMRSQSVELRESLLSASDQIRPQLAPTPPANTESRHRSGCLHSVRVFSAAIVSRCWFDVRDPLFHLKTGTSLFSVIMLIGIGYDFDRAVRNVQSQNPWQPYTTRKYDDPSSLTKFLGDCIALWVIWLPLSDAANQASQSAPDDASHHASVEDSSGPDHSSPASLSRPPSTGVQSSHSLSSSTPTNLRSQIVAEQRSDSSSDAILMMLASDPDQMQDKISAANLAGSYRPPSILQVS